MKSYLYPQKFDVIVIGAGHAGCEAALASARMGLKTLCLTIDLDHVAFMPCNPSIGGPAKGHMVREIDALGGEMAVNIDNTMIQVRCLNTKKGPAVQALRAQADKKLYHQRMKMVLEQQANLDLKQGLVKEINVKKGQCVGVTTENEIHYQGSKVVLTAGTFLQSRIFIGDFTTQAGPNQQRSALDLSQNLLRLGFDLKRFKTGTPPRVLSSSIDFDQTEIQKGDQGLLHFSFSPPPFDENPNRVNCFLTHTNEKAHQIINANIERAPLFSGAIAGRGPRYCPSIEDKVVRFPHKKSHQVFIEPEGLSTLEMYLSGLPTSLPEDVQLSFLKTMIGFSKVEMVRAGYAIEYDVVESTQLEATLESKIIKGLYCAGQVNGTSGYEEAAAQGLIAGINAALAFQGEKPLILDRSQAYIGVLIDDLITKKTVEPYRMLTSRAEYRLLLRQDNADLRLMEMGHQLGLISEEKWKHFLCKKKEISIAETFLAQTKVRPTDEVNSLLERISSGGLTKMVTLKDIFKRPELTYQDLKYFTDQLPSISDEARQTLTTDVKYEGYIARQIKDIDNFKKLEKKLLPVDLDYKTIGNLRIEAQEKLNEMKPRSLGQASRISGVNPADITTLLIYLEQKNRKEQN